MYSTLQSSKIVLAICILIIFIISGEPPGFLHSWWCVFWDLYCAAPERRDTCEHSSEAKAFHDYGFVNSGYGVNGINHNAGPAPSPLGQMPPGEMPGGPMPPGFFPNTNMRPSPPTHPSSQPSPHPQPPPPHAQMMGNQPYMGPRGYGPGGPRPGPGVCMPNMGNDFSGPPGQPMMPNNMDPSRAGPPGMNMNPRMNPPRGPGMGPGSYGPGMRGPPPNSSLGPGGPGSGPGMPPMSMSGPGGPRQWNPNAGGGPMNYSSSSPGNYAGGPPGSTGGPGPGTPIMPSPQDSSNSGGESMYTMMKNVPGGSMPGDFPMGGGPDSGNMGPNAMGSVMNGDGIDGMKNSPANGGPGTPREDSGSGMGDYNLGGFGGPGENNGAENEAILKIKESMQEEAKRFEKDSDHPDYYIP